MSAKLIVHKIIDDGQIDNSLLITIAEENNNKSETKFGEWIKGGISQKKKDKEKSSRLVVKVVTAGTAVADINLDICAKLVNDLESNALKTDQYLSNQSTARDGVIELTKLPSVDEVNIADVSNSSMTLDSQSRNDQQSTKKYSGINKEMLNFYSSNSNGQISLNSCPLEYSLEKVKENNAHIMKNIHILNRTLNYTKKKETLGTECLKSMRTYPCDTCGKCFVYETGLKRHYTIRHAITEIPPRWQVVWTCIECFQVWPHHNLAMEHAKICAKTDNADCVRQIKTSSLLKCEFCEKVFTSIPRLVRHAKTHTIQRNYECNICEKSFSFYRDAEEHWLLCPCLKEHYNFSLPKLLLCHACDRKFKNYDQLYNHRYKFGHFMAKNTNKSLDKFAYQCEICAKYFPFIPEAQAHRQKCHPLHHDLVTSNMVNNCSGY